MCHMYVSLRICKFTDNACIRIELYFLTRIYYIFIYIFSQDILRYLLLKIILLCVFVIYFSLFINALSYFCCFYHRDQNVKLQSWIGNWISISDSWVPSISYTGDISLILLHLQNNPSLEKMLFGMQLILMHHWIWWLLKFINKWPV